MYNISIKYNIPSTISALNTIFQVQYQHLCANLPSASCHHGRMLYKDGQVSGIIISIIIVTIVVTIIIEN